MDSQQGISKPVLVTTIVVVIVFIAAGGFSLKSRIDKLTAEPSPTPVAEIPVEEIVETPEPTPQFDRSQYTLRILNGTKTSGLAASVSEKLKDLGYKVERVGNATSSAIEQTTIRIKEDANAGFFEALVSDLSDEYQAVAGRILSDTDASDAEIIIGAE